MKKNRVAVLLSSYNGKYFVKEQIDSILTQVDVDLTLFIRNDGSKDNTKSILEDYSKKHKNIVVYNEENIGLAQSFMRLLNLAGLDYDYYCFADQDDVWLNNKIAVAIKTIENETIPTLYSSNQQLVDADLNPIRIRYEKPANTSYKDIIANNEISGCTFLWNKKLQEILIDKNRQPSKELLAKRIHDVWVASVASTVGKVVFDMNSYILYRQHSNNVVGVRKEKKLKNIIKKIKRSDSRCGRSDLAKELVNKYSDLITDKEVLNNLTKLAQYKNNREYRKSIKKELLFKSKQEKNFAFKMKVRLKVI